MTKILPDYDDKKRHVNFFLDQETIDLVAFYAKDNNMNKSEFIRNMMKFFRDLSEKEKAKQ